MELTDRLNRERVLMNTVSDISTRSPDETWKKNQFRKSYQWKSFCRTLINVRGNQCERCHSTRI